eukprot:g43130.t1
MRKTEYISTEFNRYGISNEKPEVKIGVSVKQQFTEEEIYKDRDSQIAAIEKTFVDANKESKDVQVRWLLNITASLGLPLWKSCLYFLIL